MRKFLLAAPLALLSACSDGQLGDNGLVRFSQVVNFAETDDFSAPIAAEKAMFVALQRPDGLVFEDETFTELTLVVEDPDSPGENSSDAVVFPLGFAQYGVILNKPGPFRLVAEDKGVFLDGIVIQSEEMAGIRFSTTMSVTTFTDLCIVSEELPSDLDNFVLHPNQTIDVSIVAETAEGAPMIGLLALTADSPEGLSLDSPLFGQGAPPNRLNIRPGTIPFGQPVTLTVTEVESDVTLSVNMQTDSADAVVACP